jgi:hypothetical protein
MIHRLLRRALLALVLFGAMAPATSGAGAATELKPVTARLVKLGAISALTSYTVERDGFRVVTTIQSDEAAGSDAPTAPVRFIVTLAPNAEARISVPRAAGRALELRIARIGDRIEVSRPEDQSASER